MSCIERAGWFSGLLSAVKLYQSVSISGPSATSKPIEREDRLDALQRADDRMQRRHACAAARQRDVERFLASCASSLLGWHRFAARRERRFDACPWRH